MVTRTPLAQEEVFDSVIAIFKVGNLAEAIAGTNDSEYGSTSGIFSRSPQNIELAKPHMEVGNFYVNCPIGSTFPGRQALGVVKMSGESERAAWKRSP